MPSPVQPTNGNVARGKTQSLDKRRCCPPLSPSQKPLFREGRESANVKESRSFHAYVCQGGGRQSLLVFSALPPSSRPPKSILCSALPPRGELLSPIDFRLPAAADQYVGGSVIEKRGFSFWFRVLLLLGPPPLARKERGNKKRIWVATRPARHRVGGSAPSAPFRLQQRNLLTLSSE